MARLIIFRGLPGSGKSTEAKKLVALDPENVMRINRDDLRQMLHNGTHIKGSKDNLGTEQTVINMEHAMVRRGLRAGMTVIDDNTNLPNRSVKALVEIAEPLGAEWEIVDFTNVPLEQVLWQNAARNEAIMEGSADGNVLHESVIVELHQKFVKGKPSPLPFEYTPKPELTVEQYLPPTGKMRAVICDIDGTVALMNNKRGPHDYDMVSVDDPNWPVINLVKTLQDAGHHIIFLSGRKSSCAAATEKWLRDYVFPSGHFDLYMRETEDNRVDNVVKLELFNRHIRENYAVQLVLDDRDQVVQMWRALGLTCLQVAEGNF